MKFNSGLTRCVASAAFIGSVALLTGCGQQGPLYLPDAKIGPHGKPEGKQQGKVPTLPPARIVDPNAPLPVAPNVNN